MTVEELEAYGMVQMDDAEMRGLLSSQNVGVLGLPTRGAPYLLPLSFGFDGDSRLYFLYVLGGESRKVALTDDAETVSFLVYSIETMFHWRSVLLRGSIEAVPADERDDVPASATPGWRPDLFERASKEVETELFRFTVEEWTGIKHAGLPPAFEPQ